MLAISTFALFLFGAVQNAAAWDCKSQTYGTCEDNIVHRYDLDDGQICDLLDCGGGRAPVKYNVPCCAAYTGTEACVNTPSYMPCFKRAAATSAPPPAPVTTQEVPASTTPVTVAEPSPTSVYVPPASSAAAPAQSNAPLSQPTASSQITSTLPQVSSALISAASSSGNVTLASSTTRSSGSSSVSASRAAQSSGAADSLRSGSALALIGLVMGLGL